MLRIGHGFDVHAFGGNRKLILGGVEIPHEMWLLGHSDADVLTHALMDALLGAAALGDIGKLFPDSSDEFLGIDSRILLRRAAGLLREHGWTVSNCDITIIAQAPKMAVHEPQMVRNIAEDLGIGRGQVSVKATTTEHLGFTGRGEGIACEAVVLIASGGENV